MVVSAELGRLARVLNEVLSVLLKAVCLKFGDVFGETNQLKFVDGILRLLLVDLVEVFNLCLFDFFPVTVLTLLVRFKARTELAYQRLVSRGVKH